MKIDQHYLKSLLLAFEDTMGPDTIVDELEQKGFDRNSSEFIFHMRLMYDNGLIVRTDGKYGFGHTYISYCDGYEYIWEDIPLRLTAGGHDFIANLRQKEVWQTIKTNFKDEGLSTLVGVARALAEGFAKKKVKDLTGIDI